MINDGRFQAYPCPTGPSPSVFEFSEINVLGIHVGRAPYTPPRWTYDGWECSILKHDSRTVAPRPAQINCTGRNCWPRGCCNIAIIGRILISPSWHLRRRKYFLTICWKYSMISCCPSRDRWRWPNHWPLHEYPHHQTRLSASGQRWNPYFCKNVVAHWVMIETHVAPSI